MSNSEASGETFAGNRPGRNGNIPPVHSRWRKGQSGNPKGRPKKAKAAAECALENAEKAVQALVAILDDETAPHASKVSAATQILDRGIGRSIQPVDVEHRHTLSDELENIIREINGEPPLVIEHND
jgi:hypothetical protein